MMEFYPQLGTEVHLSTYLKRYDAAVFRRSKPKYYCISRILSFGARMFISTFAVMFSALMRKLVTRLKVDHKITKAINGVICASYAVYAKPHFNGVYVLGDPISLGHFSQQNNPYFPLFYSHYPRISLSVTYYLAMIFSND